ncbi:MAG: DNA repair protein RecN [Ruminococcaceae bacterium]|nr:DNA repair protein RecN [Oscillospiraceae bacterium]
MLKLLHIENIAVIEQCDIEFKDGFNVLTGETGAGKSIIIDAIGAVLGYRASRDVVRNGTEKAAVSAVFDVSSKEAKIWLSENGYEGDTDEVVITREITTDGKSNARINGKPVTASMLKSFGVLLINILGQHDSQQLLDPDAHSIFIDRFASSAEYIECEAEYKKVFGLLTERKAEYKRLDIDKSAKIRQEEMLKFQIEELEAANLCENEDVELIAQQKIIRESAKITERISEAYNAFCGFEDFAGICSLLSSSSKALAGISDISEKIAGISDTVSELYYSAEDVSEELRSILDNLDFSEEDANRVEARLDIIHKLKRKYGNTVSEMLEFLDKIKAELSEIEFSDERLAVLEREIKELEEKAFSLAERLFEIRSLAARSFEERIMRELSELDMKNAKFFAKIVRNEVLTERGFDSVEFLLSANLGENEKPLDRIASGGELSRIMLAMKNVLDENDYVNTLIFDEIDTGVSGRAAQKIAEKLYRLSVKKQVLCVTHLSQLSAMADIHFKIEKNEKNGRTFTEVTPLDKAGRANELARITGGTSISETTIKNAEEMLSLAEAKKAEIRN